MDMEMPSGTYFGDPLKAAVQSGQVPVARLDDMVTRIVALDVPRGDLRAPGRGRAAGVRRRRLDARRRALARRVSEDGTVLLKNDGGALPLDLGGKRIAVIGRGRPAAPTSPTAVAAARTSRRPASSPTWSRPTRASCRRGAAKGDLVTYADGTVSPDAVAAAKASDVAIVFASDAEAEGTDRSDLGLDFGACILIACQQTPIDQAKLIADVAQANPNTIVVLDTGGPVTMPWAGQVKGDRSRPGIRARRTATRSPRCCSARRTPRASCRETFPKSQADLPTRTPQQYPGVNDSKRATSPTARVSTWATAGTTRRIAPLFPFGYGLSYTTFRYSGLSASPAGRRELHAHEHGQARRAPRWPSSTSATRRRRAEPPKQLKGYQQGGLEPGQSTRVTLPLDKRSFAHWDDARHGWSVTAGSYRVLVGGSSRDLPLQGSVSVGASWLGP